MPQDLFFGQSPGMIGPLNHGFAVTPSDTADLTWLPRAVYVGGAGDIALMFFGDTSPITFKAVPAGTILPVRAARIMATNTTATLMLALY